MSHISVLVSVIVLYLSLTLSGCMEYYVTPDSHNKTGCPIGKPCHSLKHYALNSSLLSNQENVSLLLLEGVHVLAHRRLIIFNTTELLIAGYRKAAVHIECRYHDCGIEIIDVTFLTIFQLKTKRNSQRLLIVVRVVRSALLQQLELDLLIIELIGETIDIDNSVLQMCWLTAACSPWYINNSIRPTKVTFLRSTLYSVSTKPSNDHNCTMYDLTLSFWRCTLFSNDDLLGVRDAIDLQFSKGSRVRLELKYTKYQGHMAVKPTLNNCVILIFDYCELIASESFINEFTSTIFITVEESWKTNNSVMVYIKDTNFTDSSTHVLTVEIPSLVTNRVNVTITNSILAHSLDISKTKTWEQSDSQPGVSFIYILLRNVTLQFVQHSIQYVQQPVIKVKYVNRMIMEDCKVINNRGTALEAYFSDITLSGNTVFANNTGKKGGALALYNSYIWLLEGANVSFINNRAEDVGGAIYVQQFSDTVLFSSEVSHCFFLMKNPNNYWNPVINMTGTIGMWFQNNYAEKGGDDIYGGTLHSPCMFLFPKSFLYEYWRYKRYTLDYIFHFNNSKTLSSITSEPKRVCLCDDQGLPRCADVEYILYKRVPPRYPGELFTVPAVVVGNDFGTTPGVVYSEILNSEGNVSLLQSQQVQEFKMHRKCVQLTYSVHSPLTTEISIKLSANHKSTIGWKSVRYLILEYSNNNKDISKDLLYRPVLIFVTLEDCPVGFIVTTATPYSCKCHPTLEENSITQCNITNHTGWVYRSGTVWVSAILGDNVTNGFVVHKYCPYNFCKPETTSLDLKFPNTQCVYNHSGILCGGCHGNLSLALGTSRCLPCSNSHVSLLIVFFLAGLALVFFIKVLDITVAKGTINGLVFYANIVWANKSIIFPTTETLHPFEQILQTFIAWLNLDLGIETCFIDGLDAYWKTWLQFVFPLYVWSITGVVIIASHYSTRASKIFGNNSVPVLATLILLSYAKLLRTIITSLGFSLLNYPEGTRVVWSFDGNVPYFSAAHTILFLVAVAALLILWLPYTTVLLTLQWLRRKSYLKPLRWINRWKPFFDAYFGQLKPKYHYWVGVLLLVRVALLILFATTSAILPRINILAIVIIGVLLLVHQVYTGSMYKVLYLSVLENSYIVNLTLLSATKLYIQADSPTNTPIIYTSIGIVFVQFLATLLYHTGIRINSVYVTYKRRHTDNTEVDRELRVVACAPHSMHYREPLLDSSVQD